MGCKKLLDADNGAKDSGLATVTAESPDAAAAPVETAAVASASPVDEVFTPPGACVDPRPDADKRVPQHDRTTEFNFDLDGDGKPDKALRLDTGFEDVPRPILVYVMRGSCGIFVGQLTASSVKLSGRKSKGLKSLETFEKNNKCTDDCACSDKATAFFFNGKVYQSSGKPKDIPRKCAGPATGERGEPVPAPPSSTPGKPDVRPPSSAPVTPPVTPPPATKLKCVLPSPPPCAAPHVASPKGLCQLPCSSGSCAACGGTCASGFCVGG